jgi:hypothetical protein
LVTTGAANDLIVQIQDPTGLKLDVVVLACAGDCADVQAVARGGNPPYSYSWSDGSKDAKRHLCLNAAETLKVNVADTAILTSELGYKGATASADVKANVLDCSDAGTLPPPPTESACSFIKNPSLEGTPGPTELGLMLPDWTACVLSPDVNPYFATIRASQGATYLGLAAANALLTEAAGGSFCSPLTAMEPISFSVDLAVSSTYGGMAGGSAKIELWGAKASCGMDEKLWTSPELVQVDKWQTFCATVTPSSDYPFLVVAVVQTTTTSTLAYVPTAYALIDNFQPKASCN